MIDYYKPEKIDDQLTAIRSRSGEIMYLVEGTESAFLIDTCLGIRGLKKLIKTLTEKPLSVILTHGHVDHAMGAPEFDTVYMNHKDNEVCRQHSPLLERRGYIAASIGGEEPWLLDDDNFVPPMPPDYHELEDGAVFELGGISLEVFELAGHTKGTMVVLIPEKRILITGDACNTATFLFDENSLPVETYRENLLRLQQKLEGRFDRVFMMHHQMEASKDLLKNVTEVCSDIMEGNADDEAFPFMGNTYYIAQKADKQFIRADKGEGNIIYNKQKIFKEGQVK